MGTMKNNNGSKKLGGSKSVSFNLHGGLVHENALSVVGTPRQHDSPHLTGCDNPEVRWEKIYTFPQVD